MQAWSHGFPMSMNGSTPDRRESRHYTFEITWLRIVCTWLAKGLLWPFMDLHVNGAVNLPSAGPAVLVANHLTEFDIFPMQFAIPRPIFFMGKAELFRNPLMDLLLRNLGGFPVERGARDGWAMAHARQVLEHGQVLGIFPEGTRSRGYGLLPAKTGAARLAIETNSPVVLMAVDGSQRLAPNLPHRTGVTIRISPPLYARSGQAPLDFTDEFMFQLAEMLPPRLRGVYAKRPKGF
jgi:1-acyl-sn-glycerol-3-phosphate acyltransferase